MTTRRRTYSKRVGTPILIAAVGAAVPWLWRRWKARRTSATHPTEPRPAPSPPAVPAPTVTPASAGVVTPAGAPRVTTGPASTGAAATKTTRGARPRP